MKNHAIRSFFFFALISLSMNFVSPKVVSALTKPSLISPTDNVEITSTSCTFSWSHPYTDEYEIKIKTSGGTLKYASGKMSSKSKTVDLSAIPLTYGSTYKWYVVVYALGQEDASEDRWFTYKPQGYCSVSELNISASPVILGQGFSINFSLKETRGYPKTFESIAVAILGPDDNFLFDFAVYNNVSIDPGGTWNQAATNTIYTTNPPGTYKAMVRGKVGGQWFDFDTTGGEVNPKAFTVVQPSGYCSVSALNVPTNSVILGNSFNISVTLKEIRGFPKTFESVAIAIQGPDDAYLFDFALYDNVSVSANGTWSQTATNTIYTSNPPGTYKALIRGKVGGEWFDFDVTGSGVNPASFTVVQSSGYCSVSGLSTPANPVTLGQNFSISFSLKETRGYPKTFEAVAIAIQGPDDAYLFDFALYSNVAIGANRTWTRTATNSIYTTRSPGTYKALIRGKVGGQWFDFDTTGGGVNPRSFTVIAATGGVTGKLHRNSAAGPALGGAKVTCTGTSTTTAADGTYAIAGIAAGSQKLRFSKAGYEPYTRNVSISAGKVFTAGDNYLIGGSVAKEFVYPVLGISQTDSRQNTQNPLLDGWTGNGVGANVSGAGSGHLGQDYYLQNGDSANKPVFAVADGEIVEVLNGPGKYGWCDNADHGWGPVVVIRHTRPDGFVVPESALKDPAGCGTDIYPTVIYSLYGHLSKQSIENLYVGKSVSKGQKIGTIGKYGIDQGRWTTNHLHFELKDEIGFLEGAWYTSHAGQCPQQSSQACNVEGVGTGYSRARGFAPHRYVPSVFINKN